MADQPTRQAILSVLEEHGGMHKSALCRELKKGWGNMGHHLTILEESGAVDLEKHGTRLWAFQPQLTPKDRSLLIALTGDDRQRLAEQLSQRDAATIRELSHELDYSHKVIRTHLSHLMDAGAIERQGRRPHEYRASNWLRRLFGRT